MPSSTATYPFEYKSLEALADISIRLNGELRTYLIIFDERGLISKVYFERVESTWFEEVDQLRSARQSHIFFDPFDVPEHTWVSWQGVQRCTMERFMGADFQTDDFKSITMSVQTHDFKVLNDFPNIWEVMF